MAGSSAAVSTSREIGINYMELLLEQLRHQNPLEPMNNSEMTSQLAQISQLQQLEKRNTKFQDVLIGARLSQATNLIGKTVEYKVDGNVVSGTVEAVEAGDSDVMLVVGQDRIGLKDVLAVRGS